MAARDDGAASPAAPAPLVVRVEDDGGVTTPPAPTPYHLPNNMELWEAVMTGDVEAALDALEAGGDVNCVNAHGMTPLLVCSGGMGPPRLMAALLSAGADVNHTDWQGWSALVYVSSSGQMPLLELLLAHGADVTWQTGESEGGWTPLSRAAYRGHAAVVTKLLAAGAPMPGPLTQGKTALQWAVELRHTEVVEVLTVGPPAATPRHAPVSSTEPTCE